MRQKLDKLEHAIHSSRNKDNITQCYVAAVIMIKPFLY